MAISINLSQNQVVDLSILRQQDRYAEAYEYMRNAVQEQRLQQTDTARSYELLKLETWLDRAASINGNDGSDVSEFVRGATAGVRERLGNPLSDAEFQRVSDKLADDILDKVIKDAGIPSA
jgi:Arc/MetJ-type ribon-helix-helix transcriptional regulator